MQPQTTQSAVAVDGARSLLNGRSSNLDLLVKQRKEPNLSGLQTHLVVGVTANLSVSATHCCFTCIVQAFFVPTY